MGNSFFCYCCYRGSRLFKVQQFCMKEVEKNETTIGIFLDLSKAFDTIDHSILLYKLEHCGFRGIVLKWFENYLSNRKQYVYYNSHESQLEDIVCGVPQGSILGPLLFILYVNDMFVTLPRLWNEIPSEFPLIFKVLKILLLLNLGIDHSS